MRISGFTFIFVLVNLALGTAVVRAQIVDGDSIYHVLPKDGIPAILNPAHVSAAYAQGIMVPDEQVIGVVGPKGTAVAYSTWYLDRHEIVNDVIDGVALAVTW